MASITINGAQHYYEIHGDPQAKPVILIAGMGGTCTFWAPQVDAFSQDRKVVLYDQRGTGRSERITVKSIEQLAEDLVALMDALDIERADLIGHSTGGAIALVVAAEHSERVASMMLYASVHRADAYRQRIWGLRKKILAELGPEAYAQTTSLFFYPPDYVAAHDVALKAVEQRSATTEISDANIMHSRIDAILNFECIEPLKSMCTPTLVCCAKDDMLTPSYFSEEIAALIPNAQLVLFDGGGHAFSRSRSDVFNKLAIDFLSMSDART